METSRVGTLRTPIDTEGVQRVVEKIVTIKGLI
jgi:hypothetical protein